MHSLVINLLSRIQTTRFPSQPGVIWMERRGGGGGCQRFTLFFRAAAATIAGRSTAGSAHQSQQGHVIARAFQTKTNLFKEKPRVVRCAEQLTAATPCPGHCSLWLHRAADDIGTQSRSAGSGPQTHPLRALLLATMFHIIIVSQ